MRGLFRNKRKIYYALYEGTEEVLDENGMHSGYRPVYSNPIPLYVNRSTTSGLTNNNISGKVRRHMYGEEEDYSVTINPIPDNCPIDEQSVLWVDTVPEIEPDGSTKTPFDHIITRISYALEWRALQAVKVDRTGQNVGDIFAED